jgi:CO dehydrogenase/acetyl-CoA synthase beta subunit
MSDINSRFETFMHLNKTLDVWIPKHGNIIMQNYEFIKMISKILQMHV